MVLWLLAIALLPLRMTNAHLHLCMDGQKAPVALHVQDATTLGDAQPHAEGNHEDRDLDLSATTTGAKSTLVDDGLVPALLHVYVLAAVLPPPSVVAPSEVFVPSFHSAPVDGPPPARGPPAFLTFS
ncbi:hypothetical protein [Steroidobacter sp.]|uniref:hypothetical protein n=1 Tax=Steroidobacter sp. TaxID=1978227 RepID=UPI001A44C3DD|nr:hypothetical protein [Steroidobacter sp.]MBL8270333.1 hypothetical protein [Steroidobacter sp.]